ncbi:hypothetical protein GCM10027395_02230 [Giesbergeria sinuosa]
MQNHLDMGAKGNTVKASPKPEKPVIALTFAMLACADPVRGPVNPV